MIFRIEQGNGRKDVYAVLSPLLLALLARLVPQIEESVDRYLRQLDSAPTGKSGRLLS